ncbi:MAG: hypothetical protein LBH43_00835 [Treponema sp.]|nr:hypothetical protein [Treponema sp.]
MYRPLYETVKRGGLGGEKPEEPACGTSWFCGTPCLPLNFLLNIPQPSKRGGLGWEKPEEPACGTSWLYCN